MVAVIFREANINDIKQIQKVRHSVRENVLSNPGLVTDEDCVEFLTERGKILPSRISGACARHQRVISQEIRKSRVMALLPYSGPAF